jgi:UDP-N-acetylglucosamine 2-epimerase (non-hydrolysing)
VEIAKNRPAVFPVHPRTRERIEKLDIDLSRIFLIEPLGYITFLALMASARLVITDSGGVQEETTYLGIPCLTVRPNTERPVTIQVGTNRLVESHAQAIVDAVQELDRTEQINPMLARRPELWDGRTAQRIVQVMMDQEP